MNLHVKITKESVSPDGLWDGEENGLTCDTGFKRNLFLIWRIVIDSLGYLRWDKEPGDFPYRSSGFWTGSLGCISMHMGLVPYPQGQGLEITHPPRTSSRRHPTPNPPTPSK
ncbi:unnamed protein product [Nesidiocoris tenuis]|uniref:Uncharacterized protein n=1 Tax=Nesidiocoris tenuis TaxID=355587 RepID=A0A6H5H2Y4_9HEMI|nr:unnamed protein product [Nesidiocoris tenuis]